MIRKSALKKFFARPRDDFRQFKKLSDNELDALESELPIEAPHWNQLRKHQKVCFIIGAKTKRFAYHADTGTGKTLLSIALVRYFLRLKEVSQILVLVPNRTNKSEWAREIKKHSPKSSFCILRGSSIAKWERLNETQATFVIETYAGLVRMVCEMVPSKKKPDKNKLKPSPKLTKAIANKFQGVVLDESTVVKNHRSLPYRVCRQLSKTLQIIFTLTGTPFGRDPTDLWSQMFLIDKGHTLGENLGLFRGAFFSESHNEWGGTEYTFLQSKKSLLHRHLAHCAIRYVAKESDLPRIVAIKKHVVLPHDTKTYYDKAKQSIMAAHGNYQEMKNAFLRMRQISSGFLGYKDDDNGVRAEIEFKPNPKLELLLSLVQSIEDQKIVVFHDFVFSGSIIGRELDQLKINYCRIRGGGKDDPDEILRRFDNDKKCRVMILSNAAGGFGLNLQVAKYGIYYESPLSAIIRKQTRRRVERQESKHDKVFIYDLISHGTVDQQILDYHKSGEDLFKAIVEGRAQP